jgi:hypothetical protein
MKMLFSSCDRAEIQQVKEQLFQAGICCEVHENPIAQGVFGTPPFPELRIEKDRDILAAMKLLGGRRLREMTVIFPKE